MKKREASFQTYFNHWLKANLHQSAAFELKQTRTNSIPFSVLAIHQEQALLHTKHDQIVFKIPDGSFSQSPFDCFSLWKIPAYVVILFPSKSFYIIDIDNWIYATETSKRKSLTEQDAHNIKTYGGKVMHT